ncbi:MAG: hypothetical protein FWE55_00185 [Synergistaceae bacterium]|nr:hypothetical protein [Synergistaceae bacterium]
MKKIIALQLAMVCALSFFATGAGALTVVESLQAFVETEERFLDNIAHSAPWNEISVDEALPLDPISELWGKFRPLFNLGVSKDSMEREKNAFWWKSVTYDEQGNKFRIVCEYPEEGREILEGFYDPASDRLICRKVSGEGTSRGIWEDIEFEYMKTDFGYVARFYSASYGVVHKLAIKGKEGIVSWGDMGFDSFYASMDFPKENRMWYEISGNRFIIKPWDGSEREYVIKR